MTASLKGWTLAPRAGGALLISPEGRDAAQIGIREGLRPLRSVASVVAQVAGAATPGPPERLVTREGELAAIVTLAGAVERVLGFVFGDDSFTFFDGRIAQAQRRAEVHAAVRELVREHSLGLAEGRPRRFEYAPPEGWTGFARGLTTRWCPPGFPDDDAMLVVAPARPVAMRRGTIEQLMAEAARAGLARDGEFPLLARCGLVGVARHLRGSAADGRRREIIEAALQDGRHVYELRFEGSPEAARRHADVFARTLRSIEPLGRADAGVARELVEQWAE